MSKVIRRFTEEEIDSLIDTHDIELPWDCFNVEMVDKSRWSIHYEGIFQLDDDYWKIQWQRGATEYQEDTDLWNYNGYVDATKVVLKPVKVDMWVDYEDE